MSEPGTPPFSRGEIVMINGFTHLGLQRVLGCAWGTPTGSDMAGWMCECCDVDAGEDAPPTWRGPAAYLSRHIS